MCCWRNCTSICVEVLSKVIGMNSLLEDIVECFPSPNMLLTQKAIDVRNDEEVCNKIDEDKPFSALVFKTIADPFVGKIIFV